MNLKQFSELGGCTVVKCGAEWGGGYGYKYDDHPNATVYGFKTKTEARQAWLDGTFGQQVGVAVKQLLMESQGGI